MSYLNEFTKQNCWRCQGSLTDTPRDEIIDCDIYKQPFHAQCWYKVFYLCEFCSEPCHLGETKDCGCPPDTN